MSAFDDYLNAPAAPSAGPSFDSYLGASAPAAAAPAPAQAAAPVVQAPPQGQQGWTAPGSFLMGVGDAVRGTGQDIVHGLSWAADKIAPNSQFAKDARAALPQIQQTIDSQNAQYAAQRAAQGGSGFDPGRMAGNVVGTAPTLLGGGAETLAGKIGLGALQGAAGAAMMPTSGDGGSFAQQKLEQMGVGAGLGAGVPVVSAGAKALGNALWNAAKPVVQPGRFVGQGLANAMSPEEAAQAAANIRSAQQFVPGSMPTTAQAAATPTLVQTEKAAANMAPVKNALLQRGIANNDARWAALNGVAQTPDALENAQAARAAAVEPLYDAANQQTANIGKAFLRFAQRPAVQQAMQRADTMAQNEGVSLTWPQQGGSKAISGQALDYTKRALDDMIGEAQRSGSSQQVRALTDANNYLKSWTQAYIPGMRQASQTYAQMSVPVNTMEVGQQIANGLGTRAMNAGGVPEIGLMPFRSALTQAMNGAEHGIESNAHGTLQGIGQDLQRASISNSVRSPGSDTAYNLAANGWLARNLYGPNFQGATGLGKTAAAAGALFAGHPLAAGGIFAGGNKVGQMVGSRLQDRLSDYLLHAPSVLPYLDARAAAAANPVQGSLAQRLLMYGRPAAINATTSGLINSNH